MYTYTKIYIQEPSVRTSQRVLQHGQLLKKVAIAHVPPQEITPGKFVYFTIRKLGTGHPKTEFDHPSIDLGKPKLTPFLRQGETPIFLSEGYLQFIRNGENSSFQCNMNFCSEKSQITVFSLRQAPVALGKSNKRRSQYRRQFLM